jgi:anti-sigma B factor antagonist
MRDGHLTIERVRNEQKGYDLFKLEGPLTLGTLFDLQESLKKDPGPKTILELSGVPYVDSAGLGAILSFHASCRRSGRKYALAAMPARVYTMFVVSKVDQLVHILPTVEEAETFLSK